MFQGWRFGSAEGLTQEQANALDPSVDVLEQVLHNLVLFGTLGDFDQVSQPDWVLRSIILGGRISDEITSINMLMVKQNLSEDEILALFTKHTAKLRSVWLELGATSVMAVRALDTLTKANNDDNTQVHD